MIAGVMEPPLTDPEEWAEIINGAFAKLIEPVYRYEGTLARLMGDAILAFFAARPSAMKTTPNALSGPGWRSSVTSHPAGKW